MNWGFSGDHGERLDDGLGTRRLEVIDGRAVEVLDVAPTLAQHPAFEPEVRAKAARLADIAVEGLAAIHRIDRDGAKLSIVSQHIDGIRLSDLLLAAPPSGPAALALAARVIHAVANLHQRPGLSHGAITPAHVVIAMDGTASLTDGVFGGAFELLQRNREQLWREFRVAMPTSANLPRFDVRSDVTQLGATILAVVLGRRMSDGEYPRLITDLVNTATSEALSADAGAAASRLRMWLHQALHLHPRENFANAIEADRGFAAVLGVPAARRTAAAALQSAMRALIGASPVVTPGAAPRWASPVFSNARAN